jgi:anti-sigma regulatory factor (Ser/Thr protein kinase)
MAHVSFCNATRKYRFDQVMQLPSHLKSIESTNSHISEVLEVHKYSPRVAMKICLALDEAMTNAIEHGNLRGQPSIEVSYSIDDKVCILRVVDFGGYIFNPEYFEKLAEIKDWGVGGRGIFLIKSLMDEVYFFFQPGESTTVVLIKYNDATGPGNSNEGHVTK